MKTVYAFLADGLEEVEALMVIDLLRRTKQIDVVTVSIKEDKLIESSHNIKFYADKTIDEIDFEKGDCLFLPGGMPGTTNLGDCKKLTEQLVKYNEENKYLCAICAAPSVLGKNGVLAGKKATCYPGFEDMLNVTEVGGSVVTDKNVTTANGLGSALELGLEMIKNLLDEAESQKVADAIQYKK